MEFNVENILNDLDNSIASLEFNFEDQNINKNNFTAVNKLSNNNLSKLPNNSNFSQPNPYGNNFVNNNFEYQQPNFGVSVQPQNHGNISFGNDLSIPNINLDLSDAALGLDFEMPNLTEIDALTNPYLQPTPNKFNQMNNNFPPNNVNNMNINMMGNNSFQNLPMGQPTLMPQPMNSNNNFMGGPQQLIPQQPTLMPQHMLSTNAISFGGPQQSSQLPYKQMNSLNGGMMLNNNIQNPMTLNAKEVRSSSANLNNNNNNTINLMPMNRDQSQGGIVNKNLTSISSSNTVELIPMNRSSLNNNSQAGSGMLSPTGHRNTDGDIQPKKQKDLDSQKGDKFVYKEKEVKEEEEEIPDPVKQPITVRPLTIGRQKLMITLVLSDKSTKKVFVTDDFFISDVRNSFASKLHLWQFEFFSLCVKDQDNEDRWLDLNKTVWEENLKNGEKVIFKMKYYKFPKKLFDESALRLLYLQIKENIINGTYPCQDKLAVRLGAYQMQLSNGNYAPAKNVPGFIGDAVRDYLPLEMIADNSVNYLEQRLYNIHKSFIGKTNREVMESYIDLSQQIQCFGATIYLVKEKNSKTRRFAVVEDGILVSNDNTNNKGFNFTSFKNLMSWKCVEGGFQIELTDKTILEFQTTETRASQIVELLSAYYVFLLGVDVGDLPLVRLQNKPEGLLNPKLFHKPNTALRRNISELSSSRLEIFKDALINGMKKFDLKPNFKLLLQIDSALDQDLVLDELDLSNCNMGPMELKVLAEAAFSAFNFKPKDGEFFEENLNLSGLNLSNNPIIVNGSEGAEDLGRMLEFNDWKLKRIILRNVGMNLKTTTILQNFLLNNEHLETLDIEDNDVRFRGVSSIMRALKSQVKCEVFNFNSNNLSGQVCFFLAQVLAINQKVIEMRIGNNKLDDKSIVCLFEGLKRNKSLLVLDLSYSQFKEGGGRMLLKWIDEYHNLRSLYLAGNNLGASWGAALVKTLKNGETPLSVLDISKNGIGAKNTKGIFEAIKAFPTLKELYISFNEIDRSAALMLTDIISSRAVTLRKLHVKKCKIPAVSSPQIAKALQENSTIQEFDFSGNPIKDAEAGKAWGDLLKSTHTIKTLIIGGCSINPISIGDFVAGLSRNQSLHKLVLDGNKKLGKPACIIPLADGLAKNEKLVELSCKNIGLDNGGLLSFLTAIEGKNFALRELDLSGNPIKLDDEILTDKLKRVYFEVKLSP